MNWNIDPAHTTASFKVRHLGLTTVRGTFSGITGSAQTDDQNHLHSLHVQIPTATVNTGNADRDAHLQSADFFDAAQFPNLEFTSTSITRSGDGYTIQGNLTIHGVTRPVTFQAEVNGPATDPFSGTPKLGGEASLELSRKDYGLTWNVAVEAGGVLVSDKVTIHLEVEAVQA